MSNTTKEKSVLAQNTKVLPVPCRNAQVAFIDAALAALAKGGTEMSRVEFVRRAALSAAESVTKSKQPTCEPFRKGARGALSGLTKEEREHVKTAEKEAIAVARRTARESVLAKLAAAKAKPANGKKAA